MNSSENTPTNDGRGGLPAVSSAAGSAKAEALAKAGARPFRSVLLFDGECGLCNRVVRRLLALDRRGELLFAPLQGPGAQEYLRSHGLPTEDFDTIVFVPDWPRGAANPVLRTDGIIAAFRAAGRPGLAALIALFPRPLRDAAYRVIGHTRYRIFGPWKPRPLPRPEWKSRFLE